MLPRLYAVAEGAWSVDLDFRRFKRSLEALLDKGKLPKGTPLGQTETKGRERAKQRFGVWQGLHELDEDSAFAPSRRFKSKVFWGFVTPLGYMSILKTKILSGLKSGGKGKG
jgi:hypothetical protein